MATQQADYRDLEQQQTRPAGLNGSTTIIRYPFDRFVVSVEVGPAGEFIGVLGVSLNRSFLTHQQRLARLAALRDSDADDFYLQGEEAQ